MYSNGTAMGNVWMGKCGVSQCWNGCRICGGSADIHCSFQRVNSILSIGIAYSMRDSALSYLSKCSGLPYPMRIVHRYVMTGGRASFNPSTRMPTLQIHGQINGRYCLDAESGLALYLLDYLRPRLNIVLRARTNGEGLQHHHHHHHSSVINKIMVRVLVRIAWRGNIAHRLNAATGAACTLTVALCWEMVPNVHVSRS